MGASANTGEIVADLYDAWAARDLDRVAPLLADEFRLHILVPTTVHPLGGETRGKAEALAKLRLILDQFDFLAYEARDLIARGDLASARVHLIYRQRIGGEVLESNLGHFWTLGAGRVVELIEYHDLTRVQAFADRVLARI